MAEQYVATDGATGLEVRVTGQFSDDPEDRVRIARTATLFTRLFATILATEDTPERRLRFRAVETQLEIADALIRQDLDEVQRLIRETMKTMGVSDEQLREMEEELRRQLERFGGIDLPPGEDRSPDEDP